MKGINIGRGSYKDKREKINYDDVDLQLAGVWIPQYRCRQCGEIFPPIDNPVDDELSDEEKGEAWVHVYDEAGLYRLSNLYESLPGREHKQHAGHVCDNYGGFGLGDLIGYKGEKR